MSIRRLHGAAFLIALPVLVHAQTPDTTRLDPVVVTATRSPVRRDLAPGSVTVLTGESLRARGIVRVADALQLVPGVSVVQTGSTGGATSLFVRGGNSNFVKVLVDGVAINEPGGAIDLAHLTTDGVQRIEIVRGPSSVLYGSDAVAGVVQIFTDRGAGGPHLRTSVRGGSFATREGDAELLGSTSALSYTLGAATHLTDGTYAFNNAYRNNTLSGAVSTGEASRVSARLTARAVNATFHFPTNGAGEVVDSNAVGHEERTIVGLDAAVPIGSRLTARLLAGSSDLSANSSNQPDSPGDTLDFYSTDHRRAVRRSADARFDVRLATTALLTVGSELTRQEIRSRGQSRFQRFPVSLTRFDEHRVNTAGYAQLVGEPTARIAYTVSARLDDNSRFDTFRTARGSIALSPTASTRLRAAAGNAFREPSFDETFSTSFTIGNADLRPERTRSWEISAEQHAFGDRASFSATWFDQRFRDLIQYIGGDASTDFRGTYGNLAAANARGLEVEARFFAQSGFELGGSYTALTTRVTDAGNGAFGTFVNGERLLRRPANSGSADVGYRWHDRGHATVTAAVVGRRDDRDFTRSERVVLGGYTRIDVAGEYWLRPTRARGAGVALTARVENAFDRSYDTVLGFPAPRRSVLVGASLTSGR